MGPFTLTNMAGALVGVAAVWLGLGALGIGTDAAFTAGWWVRAALALAGLVVGCVVTLRWTGISTWDKVLLWGGYQIRRSSGNTLIKPPVAARVAQTRVVAPVMRNGRVIAEMYDPQEERVTAHTDDSEVAYGRA